MAGLQGCRKSPGIHIRTWAKEARFPCQNVLPTSFAFADPKNWVQGAFFVGMKDYTIKTQNADYFEWMRVPLSPPLASQMASLPDLIPCPIDSQ